MSEQDETVPAILEDLQEREHLRRNADSRPGQVRRGAFKRLAAALTLLAAIAGVSGLVLKIKAHSPRPETSARIGRALPVIPVADASGRLLDVSKAELGSKTVIVFYSTSCEVCQKELPKLRQFPAGLGLIMVNEEGQTTEEIDKLGLPYTKRFSDGGRVFERLSLSPGLPTILLVDEHAVLQGALVGAHPAEVVRQKLFEFAGVPIQAD